MGIHAAPTRAVKAVANKFVLPALEDGVSTNLTKNLNALDWPLFDRKSKQPRTQDVEQGAIMNCPLASLLAALANTNAGRNLLKGMIQEVTGVTTETRFSGESGIQGRTRVPGTRYFRVSFRGGKSVNVGDVFYTDESSPPEPIYMTSPNNVLWPAVIEKAFAKLKGGYNKLGNDPIAVWRDIVGDPRFLDLRKDADPKVEDRDVVAQVKRADLVPMIAAREGSFHGVAVLRTVRGLDPRDKEPRTKNKRTDMIVMYDQYAVKQVTESIKTLRDIDPTLLIFGNP
jgi:hypothetical protein